MNQTAENISNSESEVISAALQNTLNIQKKAFNQHGQESYEERKAHLKNLKSMLMDNRENHH